MMIPALPRKLTLLVNPIVNRSERISQNRPDIIILEGKKKFSNNSNMNRKNANWSKSITTVNKAYHYYLA